MSANGCPTTAPTLCGESTLARGLCVPTEADCNTRSEGSRPFPGMDTIVDPTGGGTTYGYATTAKNLGRSCITATIDYQQTYRHYDEIPDSFSLLTYNIWGMPKEQRFIDLFTLRSPLLFQTLDRANADMYCFQEMSQESCQIMKPWIDKYPFASEPCLRLKDHEKKLTRNRAVEVYFVSKYRPMKITIYGIHGVLEYDNSFMVIEYPNLVIFNLYSQAGTSYSIGQERNKLHYARCRYDILNVIYNMMPEDKSCILCGDINFDLDGTIEEYPELEMIRTIQAKGFIDTYRSLHKEGGWTEDTDLNLMRWNNKPGVDKKLRYDAIFYRSVTPSKIASSRMIGTELLDLNETDSKWFYEKMSGDFKHTRMDRLKGLKQTTTGYTLPINPSDHFGVMTSFYIIKQPRKNVLVNKSQGNRWTVRSAINPTGIVTSQNKSTVRRRTRRSRRH